MKKTALILCILLLIFQTIPLSAAELPPESGYWPEGIEIGSESAIVMEEKTGTVLFEKNADEVHYPASITKIMTAYVALKYGNMSDVVTFSKEAVFNTEGSSIARDVGEQMTLEQCMYGMLLESANECAYAIAEHVAGDIDSFVNLMNEEAAALGCTNSHFANPHGLPDDNHYVSARDMALIAQAAWQNETFRIMTGTTRYEIPPTNKHSEITYLQNHNEMINPYKTRNYLYEYCVGGKPGYTMVAKSTLVTYAKKGDMTLICVVMYADRPAHWEDSINLYEYCFSNFSMANVAENENRIKVSDVSKGSLNTNDYYVGLDPNASIVLPLMASFSDVEAEIREESTPGDHVGTIFYTYAGHPVGKAEINATGVTVEQYPFKVMLSADAGEGEQKLVEITPKGMLIIGLIVAAVVAAIFLLIHFSGRIHSLRQSFYRWKNSRSPYRHIRSRGFRKSRHRRRRRR